MSRFIISVFFLSLFLFAFGNDFRFSEIEKLQKRFDHFEEIHKKEVYALRRHVEQLENRHKRLEATLAALTMDTGNKGESDLNITRYMQNRRMVGNQDTKVAFDAHVTGIISDLGRSQIIKYTEVNTNIGNMYNSGTGVFYCDHSGTYVFFFRFMVYGGKSLYGCLTKNGVTVTLSYASSNVIGQYSTMAILHLQRGDSVWVETCAYNPGDLSGDVLDDRYNKFAGFLLYPDDM